VRTTDAPSVLTALFTNGLSGLKAVETAIAGSFRNVTWLKPGVNEMPLYLGKISFTPAMTSTVARRSEITRTSKRLHPQMRADDAADNCCRCENESELGDGAELYEVAKYPARQN
jgi:hypothetical protein